MMQTEHTPQEMFGSTPTCPVCKRSHLTMGPGLREKLSSMGLSDDALDEIEAEDARLVGAGHHKHEPQHPEPASDAERARRYRERKKDRKDGREEFD